MMAKISGILPSNGRITSTDVQNERPVRPGVPLFGQRMAASARPKDEFQKISVSDDELSFAAYGADGKVSASLMPEIKAGSQDAKVKNDVLAADNVTEAFSTGIDVRA